MTDLDRALKDALVLGLENDATAEHILRIAAPFIDRAFQDQNNRIKRLEAALDDMAQYISRADWHYLKDETRNALEGEDDPAS